MPMFKETLTLMCPMHLLYMRHSMGIQICERIGIISLDLILIISTCRMSNLLNIFNISLLFSTLNLLCNMGQRIGCSTVSTVILISHFNRYFLVYMVFAYKLRVTVDIHFCKHYTYTYTESESESPSH